MDAGTKPAHSHSLNHSLAVTSKLGLASPSMFMLTEFMSLHIFFRPPSSLAFSPRKADIKKPNYKQPLEFIRSRGEVGSLNCLCTSLPKPHKDNLESDT